MFEIFVLGFNVINSLPYLRRHKDEQELNNAASPTQQLPNRKSTERHGRGNKAVVLTYIKPVKQKIVYLRSI